jgi:murein L,D-transpeptidase YafK
VSESQRQRSRRPLTRAILRRLALGLAVFSGIVAAIIVARNLLTDWDSLEIEAERMRRLAQASVGSPLAGTPNLQDLAGRLSAQGLALGAPVFIRIFKREFELELWLKRGDRFQRFATYPVCRWSGSLGPKLLEGDSQAPEGFYTVDAKALNPNSRFHRSFNLGFPNVFDRAHNRTGSFVMVHGGCASIGCFAMTDPVVDEIWRLVTAALKGGQKRFHVHAFPFRMTEENLARRERAQWLSFWHDLKHGYDAFETTQLPPRIAVCGGAYTFAPALPSSDGSHEIVDTCPNLTGSKG